MQDKVKTMLSVQATPDVASIRTAMLFNQEHTVVPCVALVEGVLWPANAEAPELALAEEFGRFPDGWNGRPVVYDHPKVEGIPVSASHPSVLEDVSIGQLFNTQLEGTKLKTEIWINSEHVKNMPEEIQAAVTRLQSGEDPVEVSTGLFVMAEVTSGEYEGKEYNAIWRNIVPDHLAVLPEGIKGACSVEDGCGAPRTNQFSPSMRAARMNTDNKITIDATIEEDCGCDDEMKRNVFQKIMGAVSDIMGVQSESSVSVQSEDDDNQDGSIQENSMNDKDQLVNELIANEATQFSDDDRDWLSGLDESQLAKLSPVDNAEGDDDEGEALPEAAVTEEVTQEEEEETLVENASTDQAPVTTDDYIAKAPEEIREVLNSGLRMHRQRKAQLVEGLLANKQCTFSKQQLDAKDISELEALVALAREPITFEALGRPVANSADDDAVPPAPD